MIKLSIKCPDGSTQLVEVASLADVAVVTTDAEFGDEFGAEEPVLEVLLDRGQDAVGRERAGLARPDDLFWSEEVVEIEDRVDEGAGDEWGGAA